MKGLNFTVLRERLEDRTKRQTIRVTFIPRFVRGEVVMLKFKGEPLYKARVTSVRPVRVGRLTAADARRDGFQTVAELRAALEALNGRLHDEWWAFVVTWVPHEPLLESVRGGGGGEA